MKSLVYVSLLMSMMLFGCVLPTTKPTPALPEAGDIRVGMTEDAVVERFGEPMLVDPYRVGKYIFYYPKTETADCINDKAACIPVIFAEGRVIGVGHASFSKSASAGDRDRRPPPTKAPPPAAPSQAPPPSPSPETSPVPSTPSKRAPLDEETRQEIERLERQVRQIPAANTMDNLRIYRYLLKLDPENPRYQKKVARYEAQYRREEDQREQLRQEREERRKRQNEVLRRYEGNDRIRIAIENQGSGRFYVWLQYSGPGPIEISPENFTLGCKDGRRYECYRCRDMEIRIEAGGSAEGRISFDTYAEPDELVFSHPEAGTVRRAFPDL
jgi:outer membrane protein assembly factor BamE (lipoprotein component of BamABCDE complex)